MDVYPIEIGEPDVAEGSRDAAGLVELGGTRGLGGLPDLGRPAHGTAGVDEEGDIEILLLFEKLDEEPIKAPIDVPIDGTQIVAGGVVSIIREFQAGADLAGAALGAMRASEELLREEVELFEFGEEGGIEEQRTGGIQNGLKLSGFCPMGNRVVNNLKTRPRLRR